MTSPEQLLEEFIGAWNAGERPRVEDYLERAPGRPARAGRRPHQRVPGPGSDAGFSQKTFNEITRSPTVAELTALVDSRPGSGRAFCPAFGAGASSPATKSWSDSLTRSA